MDVRDRVEADYLIETASDPQWCAEEMAGEQSSGTFVAVPGETPALKALAAARVEHVEVLEEVAQPSLPSTGSASGPLRRVKVTLSWPLGNIGTSLPNLVTMVAGNLFELKRLSGIRVTDIRLPPQIVEAYPGPKFGVQGTRKLTGVEGRPVIATIVKPSIGFDPEQTAELVDTLCRAGIDFIKDDELQSNSANCPFERRVDAVMGIVNAHAQRTGKKVMFAFNLTGDLDEMRRRHDYVLAKEGTCVMASINSVGLVGMIELGRHAQLPIHAHRNGWGALSRHPLLGWSYVAWQKIWRLAGADHMHVNGLQNRFSEPDESVIASAKSCMTPLSATKPCLAMPVFSSGQSAKQAHATYAAIGSTDLIFAAGGGILAHPDGPAAGVASLREAWEAAIDGVPLTQKAKSAKALARSLEAYA